MKKTILLFALGLCLAGCGADTAKVEPPPMVKVAVVGESLKESDSYYTGSVVSRHETPLSFQVGGEINARFADAGAAVKKGDVIMSLSPRDTTLNVDAAAAEVAAKESEANLLNVNLKRFRELYAADAIPKSQLDDIEARHEAATKAVEAARANLMRAKNADNYTNLTAPMDGVITSVTGEVGRIVTPGAPVAMIADNSLLEAEIEVPESKVANIATGDEANCQFYGIDGSFKATVREISPYADAASRAYRLRLTIENPPLSLTLGRSVKVTFKKVGTAVSIPLSAIDSEDNKTFCWIVEDDVVHKQYVNVEVGEDNEAKVNLPNGAVVVTAGVHLLKENMRVRRDDVK